MVWLTRLSYSNWSCHYYLIYENLLKWTICNYLNLNFNCWDGACIYSLSLYSLSQKAWWLCSTVSLLVVTVYPSIPLSSGPPPALLSQERPCWIAESPFVGSCPYLLRSTTFRQLVAKGGTLGRRAAACCVFTAITWIAATFANFLKAWQPVLLALSYKFGGCSPLTLAGMTGLQDGRKSWGHAEGMLGLWCASALSVNAEVSKQAGALPGPRDTVPFSDTAASLTDKTL